MTVISGKKLEEVFEAEGWEGFAKLPTHEQFPEPMLKHLPGQHDQGTHGRRSSSTEARDDLPQGDGDCYEAALTVMLEGHHRLKNPRLIHATVMGRGPVAGIRFGHAWVEADGPDGMRVAIDRSNGGDYQGPAVLYRAKGQAEDVREYTGQEMYEKAIETEVYGPWD